MTNACHAGSSSMGTRPCRQPWVHSGNVGTQRRRYLRFPLDLQFAEPFPASAARLFLSVCWTDESPSQFKINGFMSHCAIYF